MTKNPARVGIVVVSHSRDLANAAVSLAGEMSSDLPAIEVAAGTSDGGTGTDASRVAEAITAANSGGGVVVIMDLGSAILSAELALEFIDPAIPVRLVPAPFVEGVLAAVVRAGNGASLDEVAREANAALTPKTQHLGVAESGIAVATDEGSETRTVTVLNADGIHARPAAAIAGAVAPFDARVTLSLGTGVVADASSPISLATLGTRCGDVLTASASGPDAMVALDRLVALFAEGLGEDVSTPVKADTQAKAAPRAPEVSFSGALGVSAGRAVGQVHRVDNVVQAPPEGVVLDELARSDEADRAEHAFSAVASDLDARAGRTTGQRAEVLAATAAIARDKAMVGAVAERVHRDGHSAEAAVWAVAEEIAAKFRSLGGVLAERSTDVFDVRDRVVRFLRGDVVSSTAPTFPYVLVAVDLAPADTADLDPLTCLAIVTELGAPTSHTAIIARELGIPAVVGYAGAAALSEGAMVWVDGSTGEVVLNPDAERSASATERTVAVPLSEPTTTRDGKRVHLLANVAGTRDVRAANEWGAEGVGLFRTEFSFLDRVAEPGVAEQAEQYRATFNGFSGSRVVVRTLDAGSDKPLAFITPQDEPNPALGVRGYRTVRIDKGVLDRQLEAIVSASEGSGADVWVMAPMISTVEEASAFMVQARGAGVASVGIMIETPSAALMATELCEVVDFVSIGTNDLAQYTMAADRLTPGLADLTDSWQPAVLRLVGMVGAAGAATGTPVGVCGEAASRPDLAPVLVGLGVTSLSMSARSLPLVAEEIARFSQAECQAAAQAAIAASTAGSARAAARAILSPASHFA